MAAAAATATAASGPSRKQAPRQQHARRFPSSSFLLLLLPMALSFLVTRARPAAAATAAAATNAASAFLQPRVHDLHRATTITTTIRRRSTASSGNGARDFFIEIPDGTLPDAPLKRVHVLDTGTPAASSSSTGGGNNTPPPPLVLIGGTAQVINSWVGHTSAFARDRRFVIYEARGQGRTELDLGGASMQAHVEDFKRVCDALGLSAQPFDLAGFSFGGRVALAAAATHPTLVRRLVLTGVPADRDARGRLILKGWRASLEKGDVQGFAWSSMLLCHGPGFLAKYEAKIPEWVDFVVKNNRAEGILSIVSKSHSTDPADPFHTLRLAKRVQCPTLLLGGKGDVVAAAPEIERLAAEAGKGWPVHLIPNTGHNAVFEDPATWRRHVLEFLSSA